MSARPRVRGKLSTFVGCPCTMPPAVCCTVSTKGCRTMHVAGANKPLSQASRKARKLCINGKERAPLCGGTQLRRNLREIAAIYDDNMTSVHHGGSCKLARVRGARRKIESAKLRPLPFGASTDSRVPPTSAVCSRFCTSRAMVRHPLRQAK